MSGAGQGRVGPGKVGQGRVGQGRVGQGRVKFYLKFDLKILFKLKNVFILNQFIYVLEKNLYVALRKIAFIKKTKSTLKKIQIKNRADKSFKIPF